MLDSNILKQKLAAIDGQDYAAYQSLLGTYEFSLFKLTIQQIPKDPYAPPHTGIYQIQVPRSDSRIIPLKIEHKRQNIACAYFLARRFFDASHIFEDKRQKKKDRDVQVDELYRQIGQLKVELDWLKKKSGINC